MRAQVVFLNPDFSPRLSEGIDWQVEQMSWQLAGGAAKASLSAIRGRFSDEWFSTFSDQILGLPLEIRGADGEVLWNGWVQTISYSGRGARLTRSLQEMYNRVIVRYPCQNPQLSPLERWQYTGWMDAADSQAHFGRREKLVSISQADPYLANQSLLAAFHALQSRPSLRIEADPAGKEGRLEMNCRGWWQRLDWVLDANPQGMLAHLSGGKSQVLLGRLASQAQVAQSFWNAETDFRLGQIWLRAAIIGQSVDDLQVAVHADEHGKPGVLLSQVEHAATSLDGGWQWHCWQLAEPCLLAVNENNWIVIKRSGSINSEVYYLLESDDGNGYAGGVLKRWDGSNWQTLGQDLRFCLIAHEPSSVLLSNLLGSEKCSGFIRGVLTPPLSQEPDRMLPRWRPLALSYRARIEGWLQGVPRQSAFVDAQRNLQVIALPRAGAEFNISSMKPASINRLNAALYSGNNLLGCPVFNDFTAANEHWVQAVQWRQGKGYSWQFQA